MFDAHCDTLLKIYNNGGNLSKNEYDVSFEKLVTYGSAAQVFAVFNEGDLTKTDILKIIDILKKETAKSDKANFCVTYKDIEENPKPVSALVSLEGVGNTKDFCSKDLRMFYECGVRILSITWNNDNAFCGGAGNNSHGLTNIGKDLISEIKRLNMILDVSHISDAGFYDVAKYDGLKIVATHSNSRSICNNNRNLTDEQFNVIASRGGVVGLNTYPLFVNGKTTATVTELIRHIEHFCSLGGEYNIGLGADFDGINDKMNDIDSCEKMNILFDELAKLNYKNEVIRGICYKNFLNFLKK